MSEKGSRQITQETGANGAGGAGTRLCNKLVE